MSGTQMQQVRVEGTDRLEAITALLKAAGIDTVYAVDMREPAEPVMRIIDVREAPAS